MLRDEKLAEKERIKQARLEQMEKDCVDEYKSSDTTLHCTLIQVQKVISGERKFIKTSNSGELKLVDTTEEDKESRGDWLKCTKGTAAERKAAGICQ